MNKKGPILFQKNNSGPIITVKPILTTDLTGLNEGKAEVKNSRFQGIKDFLFVNHSTLYIMQIGERIEQMLHFP